MRIKAVDREYKVIEKMNVAAPHQRQKEDGQGWSMPSSWKVLIIRSDLFGVFLW